jgi:4-amino-4-deoxy-L-arabinose transferase-like glycosyltransferase
MSSAVEKRRVATSRAALLSSVRRSDLLLIGGAALLLRAAWVIAYGRTAIGPNDTLFYESASRQLAIGHGFAYVVGQPTAHWPPGFPFVVSLVYRLFGVHAELALGLNVVLATATTVLIYLVAERMFGRTGARIAAVSYALLPGPIYLTGLFLSETFFIFLLVGFLGLVLVLPQRRTTAAALGVAAGLVALSRGEGTMLPVIPLAIWWAQTPRQEWLRRAAILIVAMALTIVPWTIRNAHVMHAFVPVSTNASTTLWSGHNPKANGGPTYAPPSLLAQIASSNPQKQEVGEARLLRKEAVKWALHNPLKELGLIPRKLIALNQADAESLPIFVNARGDRQVHTSAGIVFTVVGDAFGYFLLFVTLASLALFGVRRLARLHPGMRGVLAYLAFCLVTYGFVYYGQWRYRIPMEPFMLFVATPLLAAVWAQRKALRDALVTEQ